jgi:hypothetical protein
MTRAKMNQDMSWRIWFWGKDMKSEFIDMSGKDMQAQVRVMVCDVLPVAPFQNST